MSTEPLLNDAITRLKSNGRSDEYIARFTAGWRQLDKNTSPKTKPSTPEQQSLFSA